jgi:hypothetical protein
MYESMYPISLLCASYHLSCIRHARSVKPSTVKVPHTIDDQVTLGHAVLPNLRLTEVPCTVDNPVTLGHDGSVLKKTRSMDPKLCSLNVLEIGPKANQPTIIEAIIPERLHSFGERG